MKFIQVVNDSSLVCFGGRQMALVSENHTVLLTYLSIWEQCEDFTADCQDFKNHEKALISLFFLEVILVIFNCAIYDRTAGPLQL